MNNPNPTAAAGKCRARLGWLLALCLGLAAILSQFQASWALPHQNGLRDTINTPVASPTAGPSSTPSPTVAAGIQRVLLQEGRDGYTGTEDTYIDSYTPRVAPPLDGGLRVKGGEKSTLIRFDLQGVLPPGAHVLEAELAFFVEIPAFTVVRALDVAAYRVLRPWQETQASWNYVDTAGAVRWAQEGCNAVGVDRMGTADDTITLLYRGVYRGFKVTESVRYWQEHPGENYGWLVAGASASTGSFTFYSSRYPVQNMRPILRIDYTLQDVTPTHTPTMDANASPTPTATATPSTPTATPMPTTVALEAVQDAYLDQWYPSEAHNHNTLFCRTNGIRKPLVQFDLAGLPPFVQILSAKLSLTTADTGSNLIYVGAYRLLRCWREDSATWKQPQSGQSWGADGASAAGEDYDPTQLDRVAVQQTAHTYQWDVTEAVRAWVQDGQPNCGLILVGEQGPQLQWGFWSSEHGNAAQRPQLVVDYVLLPPTSTPTATATPSPTASHTPSLGRIVAMVYEDANRNGQADAGEGGLRGARVQLRNDAQQLLDDKTTGADGTCVFDDLSPGWYRLTEQDPPGYRSSTPNEARVYVSSASITVPFGDYRFPTVLLPLIVRNVLAPL
ncbi:MAG: DNRLRE domain-containing protein [Chloroflexi bacterium]|nr:DNRLRE domain-containing protein [Chloroflexota bacterium]